MHRGQSSIPGREAALALDRTVPNQDFRGRCYDSVTLIRRTWPPRPIRQQDVVSAITPVVWHSKHQAHAMERQGPGKFIRRRRARHKPLSWRMILVRRRINAVNGVRTRHGGACALSPGLVTGRRQAGACHLRRRPADLGRRGAGAGGDRAQARPGRAAGALHRGPAGARAGAPRAGRDDPLPRADDRRRLRRRQRLRCPARRSGVQDGGRPAARERRGSVLAADHVPAGEPARADGAQAHDGGDGRAVLRQLRARCRAGSCSTSTTPRIGFTAGSSWRCSMPTTTAAASCRSTSTRPAAASRWP